MLTGFQQFLTTCIGKTEEETEDAPETTAPPTTDTEVSEPTETEEADAPPVAVDVNSKTHPDNDPIPLDEDTEANEDNVSVESSVDDGPADEIIDSVVC